MANTVSSTSFAEFQGYIYREFYQGFHNCMSLYLPNSLLKIFTEDSAKIFGKYTNYFLYPGLFFIHSRHPSCNLLSRQRTRISSKLTKLNLLQ